jgi:hypothetical protein
MAITVTQIGQIAQGQDSDLDGLADFAADVGPEKLTRRFPFDQLSRRLAQWGALAELIDEIKSLSRIMRGYYSSTDPALEDPAIRSGLLWIHGDGDDIPSNFPLACDTWDGTQWNAGGAYTPSAMDLIANLNNDAGYYWFGGKWNPDDVNADGKTIEVGPGAKLRIKDGGVTLAKIDGVTALKITDALQRTGDTMAGALHIMEPASGDEPVRKTDIENAHYAHQYEGGQFAGSDGGAESGNTIVFAKDWNSLFSAEIQISRNFHIAGNAGETNATLDVFDENNAFIASLGSFAFLDENDAFIQCGAEITGASVGNAQQLVVKIASGVLGATTANDSETINIYETVLKDLADEHTRARTAEYERWKQTSEETERARVAESGLSQQIADEAERAQGAESGLQTAVNSEAQARANADTALQDNIDSLAQSTEAAISAEEEAREADVSSVAELAEAAQASADLAQDTANTALSNAASAAQDAANAQHAADTAQDTADEKVDAAYVDNAVAQAQLSVQTWLAAVQTRADLPDPSTLSHSTSYLCRVINDTGTPANNGVWQLVAGAEEWTFFSDNLDFIDETEMETAIGEAMNAEAAARNTAISTAISGEAGDRNAAIAQEAADRNAAIDNKVDSSSTGTITEDTGKFPASTVITFANFFKAVVAKINGIITALGTKQNTLVSGTNIKTVNDQSLVGSGNIAVVASNFGGYRQDFFNVNSGTQFTLSLNTGWGNNPRSGILQIMASAEYANGYAKVFIACNSGTANSYAAQILETYQSTTQSNDHLFEVVSAANGVLTIKVLNPDSRYSQRIHVAWDAQSDWPLTKI